MILKVSGFPIKFPPIFVGASILLVTYTSSLYSYLLFHSLVEIFSILVAFVIFVLAWNTRRVQDNHYLLFIGIASLFSGVLDLAHTLAYKGLGVFPGYGANLATQLWVAFRYVFSLSFLFAPFFVERKLNITRTLAAYSFVTSLLLVTIFLQWFPACYVEGTGLTSFKIASEYIISFIFLASIGRLLQMRKVFDRGVLKLVLLSLLSSVASELSFTKYISVYGIANTVGHYFELLSYYLLYRAIVVTGMVEPSSLLFRNLTLSEAALRESEVRYRSLFENMIDGFALHKVVVDETGKPVDYVFLEVNNSFERHTGLKRKDITGKRASEVLPGIENDPADWIGAYGRVALEGKEIRFEQYSESLKKWFFVSAYSPMKEYFVTVFEDITEQKKSEAEIMKLSEDMAARNLELESLNKELEAFNYSISHDLRAPLRSMAGFSKVMMEDYAGKLDDQGKDYLARIRNSSEKMTHLIDDLLRLSKISRQEIDRMDIDLSKLAESVVQNLRESFAGKNVEVVIREGIRASGDPNLMRVVMTNLLDNAWKFTGKTENARVEFGSLEKDGKTVYFVKDNGAGFAQQYAYKMIWPFHRLHGDKEFAGTGIGLAIVDRIIRRHGGKVWAEGEIGKGAKVFFTLG